MIHPDIPGHLITNQNQISIMLSVIEVDERYAYRIWMSFDLLCKTTQVYYV